MVRLCPERYATERAHKLHPRATGPYRVRHVINPNAYDIAIPPDWGILLTFNVCDLVPYQGPLKVPCEPGLPPDSSESSLFAPEENDGPHSTACNVTANDPDSGVVRGILQGHKGKMTRRKSEWGVASALRNQRHGRRNSTTSRGFFPLSGGGGGINRGLPLSRGII